MHDDAATPPAHHPWCREHTPEGCLSDVVQIPGLPVAVWATHDTAGAVEVIVDTPNDGIITLKL